MSSAASGSNYLTHLPEDFLFVLITLAILVRITFSPAARRFRSVVRWVSPSANTILRKRENRLAAYLRPFDLDALTVAAPIAKRLLRPISTHSKSSRTVEQIVAARLRRYRLSLVAIGMPGDTLPPSGAARMYVHDVHWQEVVSDIVRKSDLVVLQPGESEGIRWEVELLVRDVLPERVIVLIPWQLTRLSERERQESYGEFREWADSLFPQGLPDDIGEAVFIGFKSDWTPIAFDNNSRLDAHPIASHLANTQSLRPPKSRSAYNYIVAAIVIVSAFSLLF